MRLESLCSQYKPTCPYKGQDSEMTKTMFIFISLMLTSSLTFLSKTTAQNNSPTSHEQINQPRINKLHLLAPALTNKALNLGVMAYKHAQEKGGIKKAILTIIDYSLPSSQKRMWIFDISHDQLLYNTYVAHGKNSGDLYATNFSNAAASKESSLGAYVTENTYIGGKGLSLNLKGLETGFNNNAFSRRVVMHGAWYVESDFIHSHGRAGRSWGCPAVSPKLAKPIINTIKNGSMIFVYYPDKNYITHSNYVHS